MLIISALCREFEINSTFGTMRCRTAYHIGHLCDDLGVVWECQGVQNLLTNFVAWEAFRETPRATVMMVKTWSDELKIGRASCRERV